MSKSETEEPPQPEEEEKFRVQITISSLGNERRVIDMGEHTREDARNIVRMVDSGFNAIRSSNALMLTDKTGLATFAHLDNVAFIEVRIG